MKLKTLFVLFSSTVVLRPIKMLASLETHVKSRNGVYPRSSIVRFPVPDDKVSWSSEYEEYNPVCYTSAAIRGKSWADPEIDDPSFNPKWNSIDGNVNRESHTGVYKIVKNLPQNPIGRTGICGRGILGRWGPNHAADPVVTRWKRSEDGKVVHDEEYKRPILQFVGIKRRDTGEWALPGGMVDPGEKVTTTAIREFQEEAINSLLMSKDQLKTWNNRFENFFSNGEEIFKGYVDDPRNTDNAWMETVAYHFHDEDGSVVGQLQLHAGDDAVGVRWIDVTSDLKLYASHEDILRLVLKKLVLK